MEESVEFEENLYYDQLENPDIFQVTVAENSSAERCNLKGKYEFHINTENFAVIDKAINKRLYTWPFRYVRRYGKSATNFQFEAGRKCPSGEGLFSILTKEGDSERIFHLVQTRFTLIKQRDREFQSSPVQKPAKSEYVHLARIDSGEGPTVPVRQYENSELASTATVTPPSRASDSRRSHIKPAIAQKPGSVRKPNQKTPKSPSAVANASQINMLIGENRDMVTQSADDPDNTYSIIGQGEQMQSAAQYSSVYSQKPAPTYTMGDDTYDEVHLN